MKLWEFLRDNLAFAFYGNPRNTYSEEEYQQAKNHLDPYLKNLQKLNLRLLFQSFACVIKHIIFVRDQYSEIWTKESMMEKGKTWNEYHKMIYDFNRVMQSFTYEYERESENWGKTFPIEKVIFKGTKKGQEITLEGEGILEILKSIFKSFNPVYKKVNEQLVRDFSFDFYEAYLEFQMQWDILNAPKGSVAKTLIKEREESNLETSFNRYRNKTAFYIHSFLKKYDKSDAKIPEWHKKFIGDLFISCGIANDEKKKKIRIGKEEKEARIEKGFIDTSNYNTVRRWIEEGEKSLK